MDTSQQVAVIPRDKEGSIALVRQRRSIAEKRRIVEETLAPGASVARVARAHGINANQVFGWRRLYLTGRLGETKPGIKLLPVRVSQSPSAPVVIEAAESGLTAVAQSQRSSTIHIELRQAQVRIEGSADPALLRVLLECLGTCQESCVWKNHAAASKRDWNMVLSWGKAAEIEPERVGSRQRCCSSPETIRPSFNFKLSSD